MSISLENMICIRDILKSYDFRALRFYFLSKHYRQTVNFSMAELKKSKERMRLLAKSVNDFSNLPITSRSFSRSRLIGDLERLETMFINSMEDDFNTPKALKAILSIVNKLDNYTKSHKVIDKSTKIKSLEMIHKLGDIFGIF